MSSREWATFLAIPSPATTDKVLALDPAWCAAHGVNPGAEVVLRLLRDHVIPLIHDVEKFGLTGFHFLIHDRLSGVPTTEDDRGAYIHLRLSFCPYPNNHFSDCRRFSEGSTRSVCRLDYSLDLLNVRRGHLRRVRLSHLSSPNLVRLPCLSGE